MPKIFAVPKDGVLVRHANGKPLDTAGETVERDSYWLRRERDGDVTLGEIQADALADVVEPAPAAPAKKTK
jgi:hypothetical protein